ncbi:MAG: Gfo/Idh/MocA family oxidoreductase [Planctomycetia bacterium]|nr:Gfo/Idh/MocA family oxidoreductase [Planctomycetia bacterium]
MGEPLKYIIVGTGSWGAHWCENFLPRLMEMGKAVPAAAVDINPEALRSAQKFLGLDRDRCYTDIQKAFDENPADFAIVVVPPAHHEKVVDAALAHDMHILSEKPIADTMETSCRIFHKVKRAGRKMAVTMSHRFDQDKQSLEQAVKSGKYGRLNYVICRFTHNCRKFGSWGKFRHEMPDPLLIEGTVHHFDIFRALSGSDCKTVYAKTWNPPWGEFAGDSTGLIILEMCNGVRCFYEGAKANASTMNGWGGEYFRAECESGTLELDRRNLRLLRGDSWQAPQSEALPLLEGDVWMNARLAEMFCDWLAGGSEPPNSLDDNIQCMALLFAAVESAHTGAVVDVQQYLQEHLSKEG